MAIPSSCSATPEIARAAGLLLAGELAAFPTETVYGLGADAENPQAVAKIYAAKGRPSNHPVIVHIAPGADVSYWAAQVPAEARLLMDAFWPGPLTLILKRAPHIADTVSGGQDSIGLRCPSHPVAQALLAAFAAGKPNGQGGWRRRRPISSGRSRRRWPSTCARNSPTRSRPACRCWTAGRPKWASNPPSWTCRGWTRAPVPCCCVPAMSAPRRSRRCWARRCSRPTRPRRASGTLKAHYAPRTELELAGDARVADVLQGIGLPSGQVALVSFDPAPASTDARVQWRQVPSDPARYAQALYALLRELDAQGYARIVVQAPPANDAWHAVNDRIGRAAAAFTLDTSDL